MSTFQIPMTTACALDEQAFAAHGGLSLHFGALEDDGTVQVFATGSDEAMSELVAQISGRRALVLVGHAA